MPTRHWLMKSEPSTYSIQDLRRDGRTPWEGVRNYQARNFMRDELSVGDKVLFYHSSATPTGVVGLGEVVREAYPDHFALDRESPYFDPKATADNPRWMMVDVGFVEEWAAPVTLAELKQDAALEGMLVTKKGQRLSVQPVEPAHYARVVALGRAKGPVIT